MIKKMGEDGACLFRAVADQLYGDEEMHQAVRTQCLDYIERNADYFSQYVTENFAEYVRRKGYMIKKMGEDGACLFRAVADQLYGDEEMHQAVRTQCLDYIERNA